MSAWKLRRAVLKEQVEAVDEVDYPYNTGYKTQIPHRALFYQRSYGRQQNGYLQEYYPHTKGCRMLFSLHLLIFKVLGILCNVGLIYVEFFYFDGIGIDSSFKVCN